MKSATAIVGYAVFSATAMAVSITPVSQSRSITYGFSQTLSASGFGDFTASFGDPSKAYVYQNSSIHTGSVSAEMRAVGMYWEELVGGVWVGKGGSTSSSFEYTFDLATPVPYSISGTQSWSSGYDGIGDGQVGLKNTTTGQWIFAAYDYYSSFSYNGTLDPGTYVLRAQCSGYPGSESHYAVGTAQFTFTLPEPSIGLLLLAGLPILGRRKDGI